MSDEEQINLELSRVLSEQRKLIADLSTLFNNCKKDGIRRKQLNYNIRKFEQADNIIIQIEYNNNFLEANADLDHTYFIEEEFKLAKEIYEKLKKLLNMTEFNLSDASKFIPMFDGTPGKLRSFINSCDMMYEDLNENAKIRFLRFLKTRMLGKALDHVTYTTINDYNTLKTELNNQFKALESISTLSVKLNRIRQGQEESVKEFAHRLEQLKLDLTEAQVAESPTIASAIKTLNDKQVIDNFKNGLKHPMKNALMGQKFDSLKDAIKIAIDVETMNPPRVNYNQQNNQGHNNYKNSYRKNDHDNQKRYNNNRSVESNNKNFNNNNNNNQNNKQQSQQFNKNYQNNNNYNRNQQNNNRNFNNRNFNNNQHKNTNDTQNKNQNNRNNQSNNPRQRVNAIANDDFLEERSFQEDPPDESSL